MTLTAAMATVGARFSANEIYVPEMLISARVMKESAAQLEPILAQAGITPERTAVIGTVQGQTLARTFPPNASSTPRGNTTPRSSASARSSPRPWSA